MLLSSRIISLLSSFTSLFCLSLYLFLVPLHVCTTSTIFLSLTFKLLHFPLCIFRTSLSSPSFYLTLLLSFVCTNSLSSTYLPISCRFSRYLLSFLSSPTSHISLLLLSPSIISSLPCLFLSTPLLYTPLPLPIPLNFPSTLASQPIFLSSSIYHSLVSSLFLSLLTSLFKADPYPFYQYLSLSHYTFLSLFSLDGCITSLFLPCLSLSISVPLDSLFVYPSLLSSCYFVYLTPFFIQAYIIPLSFPATFLSISPRRLHHTLALLLPVLSSLFIPLHFTHTFHYIPLLFLYLSLSSFSIYPSPFPLAACIITPLSPSYPNVMQV